MPRIERFWPFFAWHLGTSPEVAVEDDRERERLLARRLGIQRQKQDLQLGDSKPWCVDPLVMVIQWDSMGFNCVLMVF